jgi:metal-sulfur cluster biosynthetic enzyme
MVTVKEVIDALHDCVDPELGASIVDLGLVYGVSVTGGKEVKVTLTMTSPMCPLAGMILADAKLRIEALQGVSKVELELSWDPIWNPEMMSAELRHGI